ncbi:MAG: YegS/Rv2252/BmrU family lipid kinase [Angelakisella sp.]|nr:YegS/Rv2252/BmrU family lipid kinase [Angelakisella sp.]
MRKLLLIINPVAGRNQAQADLFKMVRVFAEHDCEVTVYPTRGPQDCTRKVLADAGRFDLVVCCGGDGTLNEMVSGMMQREEPVPMGYIPLGSTNDFAASLHLPSHVEEAALRCVEGTAFHMDVGSLNDRYFNYIAAFGAFTEASYATPQQIKNALGHLAYILEGVKSLGRLQPIHVRITADGETFEEDYLFGAVTNTVSLGGVLRLDPSRVLLDDGMYELLLVKNPQNPAEAQAMLSALMLQNYDGPLVRMLRASDILFESNHEISWTIDGEFGGSFSTTHILNNKNAVTLMV